MDAAKGLLVLIVAGALGFPSEVVGQSGWSGGNSTSSNPTTYERYGQPIAPSGASIAQRTQTAVSDTSASLRDSFDAGVRAAEQSINNWSGQTGSGSSAPAWPTNQPSATVTPIRGSAPIAVNGGWSSIGTAIAAPPLLVPNSPMATPNFGSAISAGSRSGQNYTTVASNDTQPLHSVLTDPAKSSTATAPNSANAGSATDWSAGWSGDNNNSNQASIGRQGSGSTLGGTGRDSGLVPLQGAGGAAANDPRYGTGTQPGNSWSGSDSWSQGQQPTLGAANGAVSVNRQNTATNPNSSFAGNAPQNGQISLPAIPQFTGQQAGQTANANTPGMGNFGNYIPAGTTPTTVTGMPNQVQGMNQYGQTPSLKGPMETPWMPLIASVLTLAGSLAANLYLGVSYLDARQKYQSLVRKTAETFRRVKAVAA